MERAANEEDGLGLQDPAVDFNGWKSPVYLTGSLRGGEITVHNERDAVDDTERATLAERKAAEMAWVAKACAKRKRATVEEVAAAKTMEEWIYKHVY